MGDSCGQSLSAKSVLSVMPVQEQSPPRDLPGPNLSGKDDLLGQNFSARVGLSLSDSTLSARTRPVGQNSHLWEKLLLYFSKISPDGEDSWSLHTTDCLEKKLKRSAACLLKMSVLRLAGWQAGRSSNGP
eukprot:gnl/TRDRNA2_/TRDRNA2_117516_c5_seq1.p2 gnl/TRDRNA2_/TRDRNA2_117516_c5~~gnl/TRDRNA2_/TRDRNA2_117516_c5_seq1.p2  ORF type:complete len:130 (+),score=16.22 gnl/TRDRNA2_/TRDRNA2_117516_c5_seq1:84-473(+)